MPAISNQFYGATAANTVSGIQSAASTRQGQSQAQGAAQGNPPYRVELSQTAMQEQASRSAGVTVAPELLKALDNDVTRTQNEMSRAISDNHLHIQSVLSDDATSSFNFFGVAMPLATTSFELPKMQPASSETGNASSSLGAGSGSATPAPSAKNAENGATTPSVTGNVNTDTGVRQESAMDRPDKGVALHDREIAQNARENMVKSFDQLSAQLNGMAIAATASPVKTAG